MWQQCPPLLHSYKAFLSFVLNEKDPVFSIDFDPQPDRFDGHESVCCIFVNTRSRLAMLNDVDSQLLLQETATMSWHQQLRVMRCTDNKHIEKGLCRQSSIPVSISIQRKKDPSIIVSSRCGRKIFLGRSKKYPPLGHMVITGCIDASESFDEATAREVYEETSASEQHLSYPAQQY